MIWLERDPELTFFVHGERWELGLSIGGFAVAATGGAITMKGKNRIDEAVWRYNETVRWPKPAPSLPEGSEARSVSFKPQPRHY